MHSILHLIIVLANWTKSTMTSSRTLSLLRLVQPIGLEIEISGENDVKYKQFRTIIQNSHDTGEGVLMTIIHQP